MSKKIIQIPTGHIIIDTYSRGELETLSIGDYGKSKNIKANFLGHTKELNGVANGLTLPLQEKWVITLSTQYGCPMSCTFCDVPFIKFRGNVSFNDLQDQLYAAIDLHPDIHYTDRLNIHYARMGDPIFNKAVFEFSHWLAESKYQIQREKNLRIETIHPVFTTMCPRYNQTKNRIEKWAKVKNHYFNGQAGLQLSINSTSEKQRKVMFNNKALTLEEISEIAFGLPEPIGRKYCLNFAYASDYEVNGEKLLKLFNPDDWMIKITPIHNTVASISNGIVTVNGYNNYEAYRKPEESCRKAGFDVLVFIPSQDEEEGLITCGNVVLSNKKNIVNQIKE